MKTLSIKKSDIEKDWWVADAEGQILGRFASKIAQVLRGKHKVNFTPHMDMGDCVVVIMQIRSRLPVKKRRIKRIFATRVIPAAEKKHLLLKSDVKNRNES